MNQEDSKGSEEVKDPWLSVLLSRLFPGAGQIYAGARARGLFFITYAGLTYICVLAAAAVLLLTENAAITRPLLLAAFALYLILFVLSIYALFDAYKITKRSINAPVSAGPRKRKPWLAAFLSLLFPGLGQFYNRQWFKGAVFVAAVFGAVILEDLYAALFILGPLVFLAATKDAFDSAQKLNGSEERFFGQKRAVVLFVVIMLGAAALPIPQLIKNNFIEAFKIPSGAMQPTLKIGDHILTVKTEAFLESLKRGDIIVFPYPENPKKNFIKRVIGMDGDKIQYVNGELLVNDQPVPSRLIGPDNSDQGHFNGYGQPVVYEEQVGDRSYRVQYIQDKTRLNQGPWIVPQDAVFVLGDNRDNSQDSRVWGPVPRNTIIAKAMKIYWSWDKADYSVRWDRIGQTIW